MNRKKPRNLTSETAPVRANPARRATVATRKPAKRAKCVICGGDAAPFSAEHLCWVCRRLKISAWRESENQPSIQE
jgi:hypothetical protein